MAKQNNKEAAEQQKAPKGYVPALKKLYKEEIVASLVKKFSYATPMAAPRLVKITINEGVGEGTQDRKVVEDAAAELALITGQKAVITNSRKDISNFKLRKGMPVGCKVTLRDAKMYEFLEKLIRVVLPRIRDFNGIADSMDGRGNYTLGIKEQIIFPEIDIDKNPRIHGMEVTFVTTAKSDEECRELLAAFGLPFKKRN
ncbi:MAG: 50S ribosomal protein L5 [Bacteroidales bacterium]|nr:50S ribosomal protein L5 [Bacteroidales bacterium]